MKTAIYTANFGKKDRLRLPSGSNDAINIDYYYFSDTEPTEDIAPYTYIKRPVLYNDLAKNARKIKILGDPLLESYEMLIWHDANMQIIECNLDVLVNAVKSHKLSSFKHPDRNDPYSEAMACIRVNKGNAIKLLKQSWCYFLKGLPAHSGLYSTGVLVKFRAFENKTFYEAWWNEVLKHSRRDQIALAYTAFKLQIKIHTIIGDIYNNPYIKYYDHSYLEYKSKNGKDLQTSVWIRKICFFGVKVLRKLSKIKG